MAKLQRLGVEVDDLVLRGVLHIGEQAEELPTRPEHRVGDAFFRLFVLRNLGFGVIVPSLRYGGTESWPAFGNVAVAPEADAARASSLAGSVFAHRRRPMRVLTSTGSGPRLGTSRAGAPRTR